MKKLKKITPLFLMLLLVGMVALSCNDSDDSGGTSRIKVSMTDAPGDYDAVFIDVVDVKIKSSTDTGESGWVSLSNVTPGIYNLLDLTGGVTVLLADAEVPSGFVGQIRLILGDNNTVVKDGVTYPLNTPSAQQSGLKLQINQTLLPNITYAFLIDFDVNQSIVVQAGGSGNFNLHPVLRITSEAISGSISGTITNIGVPVMASVTVNGVVVTANTDENGVFVLHGIPDGTYTVTLTPDLTSGLAALTIENVTVVNGQVTALGSISL